MKLVAGVGGEGYGQYSGDGGPALEAELGCPVQMAFDSEGNPDFADHAGNRVREIDDGGVITTIAGAGPAGINAGSLAGDGGPATKARLQEPTGLVMDAHGDLFVADRDNQRIREIPADGTITTFAGTEASTSPTTTTTASARSTAKASSRRSPETGRLRPPETEEPRREHP